MARADTPEEPRRRRTLALVAVLLALSIVVVAVWTLVTSEKFVPPRTLTMATGPEGSATRELGERYRTILARSGLDLRLVPSAGSIENLAKLCDRDSGVGVAFVDAGTAEEGAARGVASLGTVSFEPLWFFYRGTAGTKTAGTLAGKRVAIGAEGSGTRALSRRILELNGLDETRLELVGLGPDVAASALLRGEIDGAVMLTSGQSPAVRKLLLADGIALATYPRADAYVALFPFLTKLTLPAGVADLARNVPPADVTLLAVEGSLAVRADLPAALQYLLLEAASAIHGGPGVFQRAGRFPAPEAVDIPLSEVAREFYRSGRPFAYRYLPFWMAELAERLLLVLVPLFAVVLPVARFFPMVYETVIERRIFRLYGELKAVETDLEALTPGANADDLGSALEALARRANRLRVPLHFSQRLFILKDHIAAAQNQVANRGRSAEDR